MKPLLIFLPGTFINDTHTVSIAHIENFILCKTERKSVDTHSRCSFPFSAACIITCTVYLNKTCTKMRNGIAADYKHITAGLFYKSVKVKRYLSTCFCSVIEMPVVAFCDCAVITAAEAAEKTDSDEA